MNNRTVISKYCRFCESRSCEENVDMYVSVDIEGRNYSVCPICYELIVACLRKR